MVPVLAPAVLAAIVGGSADPAHPEVLYLDLLGGRCSGLLVGPRRVLTAAHCVRGLEGVSDELVAVFGPRPDDAPADQRLPVAWVLPYPDDDPERIAPDLALVGLATDAPVAAVPWNAEPVGDEWLGTALTIVGFGDRWEGDEAPAERRLVGTVLDEVTEASLYWYGTGVGTCHGDSGGPVLMDLGSGPVVVAITTGGDPACPGEGWSDRTDPHDAWLRTAEPEGDDDVPGITLDDDSTDAPDSGACACTGAAGRTVPRTLPLLVSAWLTLRRGGGRTITGSKASRPPAR
jgi:hypothetical protein